MLGWDRPIRGPRARTWTDGGDPKDRLPETAAAKLKMLRDREADVRAALQSLAEQQRHAGHAKLDATARLSRLEGWADAPGSSGRTVSSWEGTFVGGGRMPEPAGGIVHHHPQSRPTAARLAEAQREVDDAARKCAEIAARIDAKTAELNPLVGRLEEYIRSVPGNEILEAHRDNRANSKAEKSTSFDDLKAIRERIAIYNAEIHTVRSAPPPKADIKRRSRAQIAALAERGALDYRAAIQFGGRDIKFPETLISFSTFSTAGVAASSIYTPAPYEFMCWLFRDDIIRRIEADIDELATDEGALSDAEKQKCETEIRTALLQAERDEENIVDQIEQTGAEIRRRPDADPRALLGLSSDLPAPSNSPF